MDRSFLHSVSVRSTLLVLTNKFSNKSIFPAIFRDFWDFPDNISFLIRQFFLVFFGIFWTNYVSKFNNFCLDFLGFLLRFQGFSL